MFGFGGKGKQQRDREALEKMANAMMFGFVDLINEKAPWVGLSGDREKDGTVVAAMANWVFRFGDYGPKAVGPSPIKTAATEALNKARVVFTNDNLRVEM